MNNNIHDMTNEMIIALTGPNKGELEDLRIRDALYQFCKVIHSLDYINEKEIELLVSNAHTVLLGK